MLSMYFIFLVMTSLLFLFAKTPLSLGILLIFHLFSMSFFLGSMMNHFWFFYILILVFIGGLLILFIYATSIFPNEKFIFNQTLFLNLLIFIMISFLSIYIFSSFFNLSLLMNNIETNINMMTNLKTMLTMKIFSSQSSILYLFLVNYLFYCMIIIIKITNFFSGPLRKMS